MKYLQELDAVLKKTVDLWGIPGLAVGIVEGNQIIYARGFGVQNLDTGVPVALDSVFCITSVSKAFVACAVMQMAERGWFDLDKPITKYLPYFHLADERYRQITARHILSHTSGMPDMEESKYNEMMAHPEIDDGAAERYTHSLRTLTLLDEPGARFSYSNIAFNVLGDLIAKVSGRTFETYMKEEVLHPAGMANSTFLLSEVPEKHLAVPHLRIPDMHVNPIYPYHRADAPSGSLHSNLQDMCNWVITSLRQGSTTGRSILSPESYTQMWTAVHSWGGDGPDIYEEMGLGWTLGHFEGTRTVSHGGMGFGWTDFMLLLPEMNCGAVILCNEESYVRDQIVKAVANTIVGKEPQVDRVSWMVPISAAFAEGGLEAAYTRYEEIKDNSDEYYMDEWELFSLIVQLDAVKDYDTAIDVLKINLHVYPEHVPSFMEQARLYLWAGKPELAEKNLQKALALEPENEEALELLKKTQQTGTS